MLRMGIGIFLLGAVVSSGIAGDPPAALAVAEVRAGGGQALFIAEGVVEAERQAAIAAQVQGAITQLPVKAGDAVHAGQVLARIDARAAIQTAAAGGAQHAAARAELDAAAKEFLRQKELYAQDYISQAALERAEAQLKSARARAGALLEQAGAAQTQSGFYTLTAPYTGLVAEVTAMQGDMAVAGRVLMTVYDPGQQRVTASVPQTALANMVSGSPVTIEIPGVPAARRRQTAIKVTVLPMADPATHTVKVRLELPANVQGVTPGMFARVLFPLKEAGERRLYVPTRALFRRADITALYIIGEQGRPLLRQIRPGPSAGDDTEVLTGVSVGERVALDPIAAARSF